MRAIPPGCAPEARESHVWGNHAKPRASCPADLLALDQSKTFYKPDWFDIVGAEVKCCKEAVCVIDMSSFTKFEISVSASSSRAFLFICKVSVFACRVSGLPPLCQSALNPGGGVGGWKGGRGLVGK